jgi:hypothetical protein
MCARSPRNEYPPLPYEPLPAELLQQIGETLSSSFSKGTKTFVGNCKTFRVRQQAQRQGLKLRHVNVHITSRTRLVKLLAESRSRAEHGMQAQVEVFVVAAQVWAQGKVTQHHYDGTFSVAHNPVSVPGPAGSITIQESRASSVHVRSSNARAAAPAVATALHLDLAATCSGLLNGPLFELMFLGVLADTMTGANYMWDANSTALFFEMPDVLVDVLHVGQLLPQDLTFLNETNFCADFATLSADPTGVAVETTAVARLKASAHTRLQYVCHALRHFKGQTWPREFPMQFGPYIEEKEVVQVVAVGVALKLTISTMAGAQARVDFDPTDTVKQLKEKIELSSLGTKAFKQQLTFNCEILDDNDTELADAGIVDTRFGVIMAINPFQLQLEAKGATTSDVDICISLSWATTDDLDLHVICPGGEHIYHGNQGTVTAGGMLDVDMNASACYADRYFSGDPELPAVENAVWKKGEAKHGKYRAYVRNYVYRSTTQGQPIPCKLRLLVDDDEKEAWKEFSILGEKAGSDKTVFEFDYPWVSAPTQRKRRAPAHKHTCACVFGAAQQKFEDVSNFAELVSKVKQAFKISFPRLSDRGSNQEITAASWLGMGSGAHTLAVNVIDEMIDDAECFHLLALQLRAPQDRSSGGAPPNVSPKALWAYVNAMFWQISALHDSVVQRQLVPVEYLFYGDSAEALADPIKAVEFKGLLIKFLNDTAQELAVSTVLTVDPGQGSRKQEASEGRWVNSWSEGRHQYLLFQKGGGGGGMTFLALHPDLMKRAMETEGLELERFSKYCQQQNVGELFNGESTDKDTAAMCYNLLGVMTGIERDKTECENFLDGSYR